MPRTLQQSSSSKSPMRYGVALVLTVMLIGCGDTQEESPDASKAKAQIRAALPEAAGIPVDEFDATFHEDYAPPSLAKVTSQSLTHIFFHLGRPVSDANPDDEFDRVDVIVDPNKITAAINGCREKGYVSRWKRCQRWGGWKRCNSLVHLASVRMSYPAV